ncbi:3615_t:CDS:2, partial [Racocetra persica]
YINHSDFINYKLCTILNSDDTKSEGTSNSEDLRNIVWTIALGASFPSWDSFETSLELYRKKKEDSKPKYTTDHI